MKKRAPISEETREKLSKASMGRKNWLGKKHSEETKLKMSNSHKGINTWMLGRSGEDNPAWKGDKAGYDAIHTWIRKIKGKAIMCSFNLNHQSPRYEWANVSGAYLRNIDDFVSLCKKCHSEYDWIRRGRGL